MGWHSGHESTQRNAGHTCLVQTLLPAVMAEGVAFAAGVIAVIQISENVIGACCQYYQTAKDSKKAVVSSLKTSVDHMRILFNSDANSEDDLGHQRHLVDTLKSCESAVGELATKLGIGFDLEYGIRARVHRKT